MTNAVTYLCRPTFLCRPRIIQTVCSSFQDFLLENLQITLCNFNTTLKRLKSFNSASRALKCSFKFGNFIKIYFNLKNFYRRRRWLKMMSCQFNILVWTCANGISQLRRRWNVTFAWRYLKKSRISLQIFSN